MNASRSKILAALFFFSLGFMTNGVVDRLRQNGPTTIEGVDRYPVNPEDFDSRRMIEAMNNSQFGHRENIDSGPSIMGEISQREDDKFVYYEIPIIQDGHSNHELKVEVKNDMIRVSEILKEQGETVVELNSERMFSIDPGLDGAMAEVLNEKDRVLIKIPKKSI